MWGLGEAICVKLAALGYRVVTAYSPSSARVHAWLRTMKEQGFDFHAYSCDVADWYSCCACVRQITLELGPIDVLVNMQASPGT